LRPILRKGRGRERREKEIIAFKDKLEIHSLHLSPILMKNPTNPVITMLEKEREIISFLPSLAFCLH
jgi:hypothetical protein